jgi:predicted AlkP superfamily phosphohydrolase/phosphomutase/tetratricopeptide (TPR) repeat protein
MSDRIAKRVLLVGWDAADWAMIRPLITQGKMPTLAALIERGVSGNLATIQPILSPMLWNSIAAGKRADKHGICGFVEPKPDRSGIRPVSSTSRRCKAIWNILTQSGLTSNVVSWFASHPAEPIRGAIVTDRYAAQIDKEDAVPVSAFHPPELQGLLNPLVVRPSDLDVDALLPFVPRAAEIDQDADDRLAKLATLIARTSTVHAAACRLVTETDWDFTAVYYSGIDEFGHHFMPYHPPRLPAVSEKDARIYGEVMEGCYRFHDMMLEALLAYAGDDTTVLLVSDHGFHAGSGRPSANAWLQPETWHRQFGVASAAGPGIRSGETLYGATLLDVTPTILTLFGLPIGDDMDGRPWLEILDRPVAPERIDSWETVPGGAGLHNEELREDPVGAAEVIRRLVELGYLRPPCADVEQTIRRVLRDRKINLAVALTSSRRAADALTLWSELATEYPDEQGFLVQLASCYSRLGRMTECRDTLERISGHLTTSPYVQLMHASVALADGARGEARRIAHAVNADKPQDASILNRLGELFLRTAAWSDAKAAFRNSLELVQDNPVALDGLAQVSLHEGEHQSALENALLAVGLVHYFPAAHFHLGEALTQLGRERDAIAAYETSLGMGYEPAETHRRLATLYRLRNPTKAKRHEEWSHSM